MRAIPWTGIILLIQFIYIFMFITGMGDELKYVGMWLVIVSLQLERLNDKINAYKKN
jgi:hypothetical protein